MNKKGRLIIISSPSGGGKTSVINELLKRHANMVHSISCTTRAMRPTEENGKYYHHITEKEFRQDIDEGNFAEWNEVHNNLYGTPKGPIDKWISEGKDVVLDLDVIGGLKLRSLYPSRSTAIFILPPSIDELKKRLSGRGTDSRNVQELRIKNALQEITYKDRFDHQVINDDLGRAVAEIEKILQL